MSPRSSPGDYTEPVRAFYAAAAAAAAGLIAVLVATRPLTPWEYDGLLFAGAVRQFDPLAHHPHPPGYPVYVGLGKLAHLFGPDPFSALVLVSMTLTVVGFLAAAAAFGHLLRDRWLGLSGALLFYGSAGMLVHASLPLSDTSAVAFLALTVWQMARPEEATVGRAREVLIGASASLAVGCRPQLVVLVVPLLALFLAHRRSPRRAGFVLGTFAVVSGAWLLPLVVATGGVPGFMRYEMSQAADFAANDADLARSGWRWTSLVLTFVAHPWGNKLLSTPVLGCAGLGALALFRRRAVDAIPFVVAAGLYLTFAGFTMDPIDSVRYALPATMAVALLAAAGLGMLLSQLAGKRRSFLAVPCALILAAGSFRYAAPLIRQRHMEPSPPVQAAEYARQHLPPDAVILYERPLQPHARQLFAGFETAPLGEDFGEFVDRAHTPVYVLADGGSAARGAVSFSWRDSDAYGKLTRNHYRVVSLVPVPPEHRYRAVRGVYRPERTVDGQSWRWLAPKAVIELPQIGAPAVAVRIAVPDDYPWPSLDVTVRAEGGPPVAAEVRPGAPADLVVSLPGGSGAPRVRIESERTFVPASVPQLLQRDQRELGVMLLDVEQRR